MTSHELINYLKEFPEDAEVTLIATNPVAREHFLIKEVFFIKDEQIGHPFICIEVSETKDMDEEMIKACEEDEGTNESD